MRITMMKNTVMTNSVMKDTMENVMDMTPMRKCMFTTSAAKIADITAVRVRKAKGAASSMQGTIMSVFRNHTGAISGKR